MYNVEFKTYDISAHNPIENYPGKSIVALSDSEDLYILYIHLKNGLGLSSIKKLTLHEAAVLAFRYADGLGYPDKEIWIDLPDSALEQSSIFSHKLKKRIQKIGLYWKR